MMASEMLLLPQPLGPTMPVTPPWKDELLLVAEGLEADDLDPFETHDKSAGRGTPASLASPSPCGKAEG